MVFVVLMGDASASGITFLLRRGGGKHMISVTHIRFLVA
jgi:hypothetical protein